MGWEKEYEEFLASLDAVERELLAADGVNGEEIGMFLSEDGEERRRFLKQALLAGGGVAAANLLLSYRTNASTQTAAGAGATAKSASIQNEMATRTMPVTLRVNGKSYPLQLQSQVTLLDALRERIGLSIICEIKAVCAARGGRSETRHHATRGGSRLRPRPRSGLRR